MMDNLYKATDGRMQKSIEALRSELLKLRTGRAHPSLLEQVRVAYYGNEVPLKQIASVSVGDARTLMVTPWDKNMVSVVEKAIIESNLGLNPVTAGQVIRIPLPPMTQERRKELVKMLRDQAEASRIAIRNIRRDANAQIKESEKQKTISEDEQHRGEEKIQKLTDKYIAEIERILSEKESDIMAV